MKTSILSTLFGGSIAFLVLLQSGASLATNGMTFTSLLNLALGSVLYVSTILFWGDTKRHEAKMEAAEMMLEFTEDLRKTLDEAIQEKPPKAGKK